MRHEKPQSTSRLPRIKIICHELVVEVAGQTVADMWLPVIIHWQGHDLWQLAVYTFVRRVRHLMTMHDHLLLILKRPR